MPRTSWMLAAPVLILALQGSALAQSVQPGAYTLTISPAGGDEAACGNIRGSEEVTVQNGAVRSSLIKNLRLAVASGGGVSGSGFENLTGWGAVTSLTGKQTPAGYGGDLVAERCGHTCYGTWALAKPGAADAADKEDVQARLKKLKQLFDDGLITKDEYDAKRKQLLDAL